MKSPMDVSPDGRSAGGVNSRSALALQHLAQTHGAVLLRFIQVLIPAELQRLLDPQDIVQDTFYEAFQRLAEFTPYDEAATLRWLKTIARNRLIDLVRRHRADKRDVRRTVDEVRRGSVVVMLQELAVHSRTPSQSAAGHEFLGRFEETLGRLPSDYGAAVRYRYVDGLAFKEVAGRLGRTEDAVRMLAARGLRMLRERMGSLSHFA